MRYYACRIAEKAQARRIADLAHGLRESALNDDGWRDVLADLVAETQAQEGSETESDTEQALAFPDIAWRGTFATYREAMEGTTEASDIGHFAALWAVVAARLRRQIWIEYGVRTYPNVYLVNCGDTGDMKTTAARGGLNLLPTDGRVKILRGVGSGEALGEWLGQADEGGSRPSHLLFLEELAGLLTRGRWDGSTLTAFLTEVFDCPDVYEIPFRKSPIRVDEPTVSIIACTTPAWFWKAMREIDIFGGFGNRFLYVTGTPKPPIAMPTKPNSVLLEQVRADLATLETIRSGACSLTPDALQIWERFYHAWRATERDPLSQAATKRIPAYMLKLGMLYAALEKTVPSITADQIKAAIAVGHYAARCADRLMGQHHTQSEEGRVEEAIRRFLRERAHTKRELKHRLSGRVKASLYVKVLESMARSGEVLLTSGNRQGQVWVKLARWPK